MTWEELKANVDFLKSGNQDMLQSMTDEEIQNMYLEVAKSEMQLDIETSLSLVPNDTVALDAITDKHLQRVQNALAYKQLQLFYKDNEEGEGSRSRERLKYYTKEYATLKETFIRLKLESVATLSCFRINR